MSCSFMATSGGCKKIGVVVPSSCCAHHKFRPALGQDPRPLSPTVVQGPGVVQARPRELENLESPTDATRQRQHRNPLSHAVATHVARSPPLPLRQPPGFLDKNSSSRPPCSPHPAPRCVTLSTPLPGYIRPRGPERVLGTSNDSCRALWILA